MKKCEINPEYFEEVFNKNGSRKQLCFIANETYLIAIRCILNFIELGENSGLSRLCSQERQRKERFAPIVNLRGYKSLSKLPKGLLYNI